jgi:hypothetical protein
LERSGDCEDDYGKAFNGAAFVADTDADRELGLSCGCRLDGTGRVLCCPTGHKWPKDFLTRCPD